MTAGNEAWGRKLHAMGEVLPVTAEMETQGQKALSAG